MKYINQVPHTDHCVWLPIFLDAYLGETGDGGLLAEVVEDRSGRKLDVAARLDAAMDWLLQARDARGLSFIAQGDWCDPMNMVGYRGKGVSGWLTLATAYALKLWSGLCARHGRPDAAARYAEAAAAVNAVANRELWDGDWYARGITDDGVRFGIADDAEGRIYLNPRAGRCWRGPPTHSARRACWPRWKRQLHRRMVRSCWHRRIPACARTSGA